MNRGSQNQPRKNESLLALEWDEQQVVAVEARISPGRVRVRNYFQMAWPDDVQVSDDPEAAGRWLGNQLDQAGFRAKRAVVTLPRASSVLKHLELPDGSDEDLPRVVQYQAASRSSLALDELCIDFTPLPKRDDFPGRDVLLATVPRSLVSVCQQVVAQAGLQLISLGLRPLAAVEIVAHTPTDAELNTDVPQLVISRATKSAELSLIWRGRLVFSHTTQITGIDLEADSQTILDAMSRMLATIKSPVSGAVIQQAWLLGGDEEFGPLSSALMKRLDCQVRTVDPFDTIKHSRRVKLPAVKSSSVGPLGILLSLSGTAIPTVNFLAPRKPIVKRDRRASNLALAAALAVMAAVAFWIYRDRRVNELDQRIQQLAAVEADLNKRLENGDPILDSAQLVEHWTQSNLLWLDELLAFTDRIPDAQRAYFFSLQLDLQDRDFQGGVKASGYARDRGDVMALNRRLLAEHERLELLPRAITPSKIDKFYPFRFDVETFIKQPATPLGTDSKPESNVQPITTTNRNADGNRQLLGDTRNMKRRQQ